MCFDVSLQHGSVPLSDLGVSDPFEEVREIALYYTCWWYSWCNFPYRQHYENTCSYNFDCWIYTNMYFFIFILCLNTITSMIKTHVFFDFTDFQVPNHQDWKQRRHPDGVSIRQGQRRSVSSQTTTGGGGSRWFHSGRVEIQTGKCCEKEKELFCLEEAWKK